MLHKGHYPQSSLGFASFYRAGGKQLENSEVALILFGVVCASKMCELSGNFKQMIEIKHFEKLLKN